MTHEDDRPKMIVVRHGETAWSLAGRHTGRTDLPLLPQGEVVARRLVEPLGARVFAQVLTSPRTRAMRTAELAGFGDRAQIDDDLVEWDYGADEGRTAAEIGEDRPGWEPWRDGYHGGELLAEVAARAQRVIDRALAVDGDTLVFAHGHLLRILATQWMGLSAPTAKAYALDPATISVLAWHRDAQVLKTWNAPV
jgi:probable phosphoglycerate mutase